MTRPKKPGATKAYEAVGWRIRRRRIAAGLTLEDMGLHLKITPSQVHNLELAQRTLDVATLMAMADRIGCKPAEFFEGGAVDGLSTEAIHTARLIDSLTSVGLRHTLKGFVAKMAAYDKERAPE